MLHRYLSSSLINLGIVPAPLSVRTYRVPIVVKFVGNCNVLLIIVIFCECVVNIYLVPVANLAHPSWVLPMECADVVIPGHVRRTSSDPAFKYYYLSCHLSVGLMCLMAPVSSPDFSRHLS